MAADMCIHAITEVEKWAYIQLEKSCIGSKYFSDERQDKEFHDKWNEALDVMVDTPAVGVGVGEVSWLKAALFEDGDTFVPKPIETISEIVGEDFPVIDDEMIAKIEAAMKLPNTTGYSLGSAKDILQFLKDHKGRFACAISW